MSRFGLWKIGDTEYDLDDLSLNEVAGIEEMFDKSISELDWGSARVMRAIVWKLQQRTQPELTLEEAGETTFIQLALGDEEMPPLPPVTGEEPPAESAAPDGSGLQLSVASTPG
jgi:hypothetical protein